MGAHPVHGFARSGGHPLHGKQFSLGSAPAPATIETVTATLTDALAVQIGATGATAGDAVHWVLFNASENTPSAAETVAGTAAGGVAAVAFGTGAWVAADGSFSVTGVDASGELQISVVIDNGALSNVGVSNSFVTVEDDFDITSLFSTGQAGFVIDPSDVTTVYQDDAGTTAAASGDPIGRVSDAGGNGNHATQSTAGYRPTLRGDGSRWWIEHDGTDDQLAVTVPNLTDDMYLACRIRTTDSAAMIVSASGSEFIFFPTESSSGNNLVDGVGAPVLRVDGAIFAGTTRGDLHAAIADGEWHTLEAVGADMSAGSWGGSFLLFGYQSWASAWDFSGDCAGFVLCETPTEADQAGIRAWLHERTAEPTGTTFEVLSSAAGGGGTSGTISLDLTDHDPTKPLIVGFAQAYGTGYPLSVGTLELDGVEPTWLTTNSEFGSVRLVATAEFPPGTYSANSDLYWEGSNGSLNGTAAIVGQVANSGNNSVLTNAPYNASTTSTSIGGDIDDDGNALIGFAFTDGVEPAWQGGALQGAHTVPIGSSDRFSVAIAHDLPAQSDYQMVVSTASGAERPIAAMSVQLGVPQ